MSLCRVSPNIKTCICVKVVVTAAAYIYAHETGLFKAGLNIFPKKVNSLLSGILTYV